MFLKQKVHSGPLISTLRVVLGLQAAVYRLMDKHKVVEFVCSLEKNQLTVIIFFT